MVLCIESFQVGPARSNTSIVYDSDTKDCIIFDAGGDTDTHSHFDHIDLTGGITSKIKCPVHLHEGDIPSYNDLINKAKENGWPHQEVLPQPIPIKDGEEITIGGYKGIAIHTPGHTPGSCIFSFEDFVIAGDTLMREGSPIESVIYHPKDQYPVLKDSIRKIFKRFPGNYRFVTGHGGTTTFDSERKTYPFIDEE